MSVLGPAGEPVAFTTSAAGWSALGACIITAKQSLDQAVNDAMGTWTGDAATSFQEWWTSRSAPLAELGAACEALAALLTGDAVATTAAANAEWLAVAAGSPMGEPGILAITASPVWAGGPAPVIAAIQACFTAFLADPLTAAEAEAQCAACIAAATALFVMITTSIEAATAAAGTIAALAGSTSAALMIEAPPEAQGSTMDLAMGVGLPVAMGAADIGGDAVGLLKAGRGLGRTAGESPIPFQARRGDLTEAGAGHVKARPASDPLPSNRGDLTRAGPGDVVAHDPRPPRPAPPRKPPRPARPPGMQAPHPPRPNSGDDVMPVVEDLGVLGAGAAVGKKEARDLLRRAGLAGTWGKADIGHDVSVLGRLRGAISVQPRISKVLKSNSAFLNGDQVKAITRLSGSSAGQKALHRRGFWTDQELEAFIDRKDWSNWENLSPQQRLQLATRMQNDGAKTSPAYWMAQSILAKTDNADGRAARPRIYEHDAAQWRAAMQTGPGATAQDQARAGVLRRLFATLEKGGLQHQPAPGKGFTKWPDDVPVAVALSHGGRVEIRIPAVRPGEDPDAFFKHVFGTDMGADAGLFKRPAGTHYVEIGRNATDRTARFKERLGYPAAFKAFFDRRWTHYGLDVPVGGAGNRDAAGNVIAADGGHGHLYVGYRPPSNGRDGVLLVGAETDAPHATNPLGHKHDWRAISAEMGPADTHKSDRIGGDRDGRLVDLNKLAAGNPDWLQTLKQDRVMSEPQVR